jgi:peptide/nickel transport system permease protein
MMPVLLWSDLIFMVLILVTLIAFFAVGRESHWREAWLRVISNRLGMASLVIIFAYFSIAFLDSIHFHPDTTHEIQSVLDKLLAPLGEQSEKTYSAPFATTLYNKETVITASGEHVQAFSPLVYVGNSTNLFHLVAQWALLALGLWLGLVFIAVVWRAYSARESLLRACRYYFLPNEIAWRVLFVTTGVLLLVGAIAFSLASQYHILGTNKIGNDVFYQALKSVRTDLLIGLLTIGIMLPFAIILGMLAGYFRGWLDDVIQYVYTTLSSIPDVLLIAAAILSLQIFIANHPSAFQTLAMRADLRLLALCAILGVTSWTSLCRLVRAETLKLREMEYVRAAKLLGSSYSRIIARHLLPNLMHIVIITAVLEFSGLILAEAVLTYVGVGVDPSMQSWGNMINAARMEMAREPIVWWPLLAAFIFMFTLVIAVNLLADAVRDAFDPRIAP